MASGSPGSASDNSEVPASEASPKQGGASADAQAEEDDASPLGLSELLGGDDEAAPGTPPAETSPSTSRGELGAGTACDKPAHEMGRSEDPQQNERGVVEELQEGADGEHVTPAPATPGSAADRDDELGPNDDGPAPARIIAAPPRESQPQAQPPRMPVPYVRPTTPSTPLTARPSVGSSRPEVLGSAQKKKKKRMPCTSTVVIDGVVTPYAATYANDERLWKEVIQSKLAECGSAEDLEHGDLSATEMRILRGKIAALRAKEGIHQKGDGRQDTASLPETPAPLKPAPPQGGCGRARSGRHSSMTTRSTGTRPHVPAEERSRAREVEAILREIEDIRARQQEGVREMQAWEAQAVELRRQLDSAQAAKADEYDVLELGEQLLRLNLQICSSMTRLESPNASVLLAEMRRLRVDQNAERQKAALKVRRKGDPASPMSIDDAKSSFSAATFTSLDPAALELRTLYDTAKLCDPESLHVALDLDGDGYVGPEDLAAAMHALTSEFWTRSHVHKLLGVVGCGDRAVGLTMDDVAAGDAVRVIRELVEAARDVSLQKIREKQKQIDRTEATRRAAKLRHEERCDAILRKMAAVGRDEPAADTASTSGRGPVKRSLIGRSLQEVLARNELLEELLSVKKQLKSLDRGGGTGMTMLTPGEEHALRAYTSLSKQQLLQKDAEKRCRYAHTSPPRTTAVLERIARQTKAKADRSASTQPCPVRRTAPARPPYKLCVVSADHPHLDAVYTYTSTSSHLESTTWVSSTIAAKVVYQPSERGRWTVEGPEGVVCEAEGHALEGLVWDASSQKTVLIDAAQRKELNATGSSLRSLYARHPAASSVYRLCPTPASKAKDPLRLALDNAHRVPIVKTEDIWVYQPPYAPFT